MRIHVGKILGTCVQVSGALIGGYLAKVIRQTEEKPTIPNKMAQMSVIAWVAISASVVNLYLGRNENLVIDTEKKDEEEEHNELGEADRKFVQAIREALDEYDETDISPYVTYTKIRDIYARTVTPIGIFGYATALKILSVYDKVHTMVKGDKYLYSKLLMDDIETPMEKLEKKEKDFIEFFDTVERYTNEIQDGIANGIKKEQWFKVVTLLGLRQDVCPEEAIEKILALINAVFHHPNGTDTMEFKSIDELTKLYEESDVEDVKWD